jgi:hypothetical protein
MSTVNDAWRGPSPVGVKTTLASQDSPAATSLLRHVLEVTTKSEPWGPDIRKPSRWTGVSPTFRAAMVRDSLGWLTATGEKDTALWSSATAAAAGSSDVSTRAPATTADTTTSEAPAVRTGPEIALCPAAAAWAPDELA